MVRGESELEQFLAQMSFLMGAIIQKAREIGQGSQCTQRYSSRALSVRRFFDSTRGHGPARASLDV